MITSIKKRFSINRVVFVVDRGMISKENIRLLDELGLEYIIGVKLRQQKEVKEDVISRAGRYKEVSKNLPLCRKEDRGTYLSLLFGPAA